MEIIGTSPKTGNPIFDVGEYKDVLSMEQTLNYENISKYVKATLSKNDDDELNAAIENIFRQPVMVSAYRKHGIKPEFVDEYIESRKQQSPGAKISMMMYIEGIYNDAANSMEEEIEMPRISGSREWLSLELKFMLSFSATVPMKKFVAQKNAENKKTNIQKTGWQKLVQMLKIKKGNYKS